MLYKAQLSMLVHKQYISMTMLDNLCSLLKSAGHTDITDNPDLSLQHKQMDIENRAFNANLWVTASPRFPLTDSDVATNFALAWLVPNPALNSRLST